MASESYKRKYLISKEALAVICFGINIFIACFSNWYISLTVTFIFILIFDKYVYAVLLFFSLFEIKISGYISIYNLASLFYIIIFIFRLVISKQKLKFIKNGLPIILVGIMLIIGIVNATFFFSHLVDARANFLNSIVNLVKVFISFILYLDFALKQKDEIINTLKWMSQAFIVGIPALLMYFVSTATTYSIYMRHEIIGVNVNDYAARLAVICVPISVYLFSNQGNLSIKIGSAGAVLASLYMIMLTGSRTGFLSFVLVLLLTLLFYQGNKKVKFIIMTAFALSSSYIFTTWGAQLIARTMDAQTLSQISTNRFDIWIALIRSVANEHFLFGYGAGRNVITAVSALSSGIPTYDHNIFLSALVSFGVSGFIVYAVYVLKPVTFFLSARSCQHSEARLPYIMVAVAAFGGLLLCWVFEEVLIYSIAIAFATNVVTNEAVPVTVLQTACEKNGVILWKRQ